MHAYIQQLPRITHYLIILVFAIVTFNARQWERPKGVIQWDVASYYAYLPATFVYNDLSLKFYDKDPEKFEGFLIPQSHQPDHLRHGETYFIKTSMGMSMLYAPFFFIAHAYALNSDYEADGFSQPYRFMMLFGNLFFLAMGLFFLRKLLLRYFEPIPVAITLFALTIGTNLLWYATLQTNMTHTYTFGLYAIYILASLKWHESEGHSIPYTLLLGLLLGIISLIRPTNIVILLFLILCNIVSLRALPQRILFFLQRIPYVLLMMMPFFMVWAPQFLYWKWVSGQWFFFSYSDEGFFFTNPQFLNAFFHYRNGWLLYTPIMLFALLGLPILYRTYRELFIPIMGFLLMNTYIVVSWWCWWYVGFGNRAFIDSYTLLAFPFAAFAQWVLFQLSSKQSPLLKRITRTAFASILVLLVSFSIFQTVQYRVGLIHWNSMTKKAYWSVFLTMHPKEDHRLHWRHPNHEKAMKEGVYEVWPDPPI